MNKENYFEGKCSSDECEEIKNHILNKWGGDVEENFLKFEQLGTLDQLNVAEALRGKQAEVERLKIKMKNRCLEITQDFEDIDVFINDEAYFNLKRLNLRIRHKL